MLRAGHTLANRFELIKELGAGGMARVWHAYDRVFATNVAVKVLRPEIAHDAKTRARFEQEAQNTRRVRSPHVVEVHEFFGDGDLPFLVMPLLIGESLHQSLHRTGQIRYEQARDILIGVLRGLAVAHAAGIVHRDVKPHNIFLEHSDDDSPAVKLIDFGVARDHERNLAFTDPGIVVGTPLYMAPEVRSGHGAFQPSADVYAAALVVYEMVTGTRPTPHVVTKPTPLHETQRGIDAGTPHSFGRVIDRALSVDASDRFANASDFLAAVLATTTALTVGDVIDGRYVIEAVLGDGGMATVYRVADTRLGHRFALKMLDTSGDEAAAESIGRFRDECEMLIGLDHPNIVRIHAVGSWAGSSYCVLDLIEGQTLAACTHAIGWHASLAAIDEIADALDAAHQRGIVHRDVKADNIMLRPDGSAVLIDFGVARLGERWRTRTDFIVGTIGAQAPEQLVGMTPSAATDQWAVAALMYEMLTGTTPGQPVDASCTEERAMQTMENVAAGEITQITALRPDLDVDLADAIHRGLAADPANRFASVGEFVDCVKRMTRPHRYVGLATAGQGPAQPRRARRRVRLATLIGLLVVAAVGVGSVFGVASARVGYGPETPAHTTVKANVGVGTDAMVKASVNVDADAKVGAKANVGVVAKAKVRAGVVTRAKAKAKAKAKRRYDAIAKRRQPSAKRRQPGAKRRHDATAKRRPPSAKRHDATAKRGNATASHGGLAMPSVDTMMSPSKFINHANRVMRDMQEAARKMDVEADIAADATFDEPSM